MKPTTHLPEPLHAPIHVVFSSPENADTHIRMMIERSKKRTSLVIITSDHEILNFARVCSCTTHTSKFFSLLLFEAGETGEEKEQTTISKAEVEQWLKIFEKGKS